MLPLPHTNTNSRKVRQSFFMVHQKNLPMSIRELMPSNYTVELARRTGSKNVSNLSQIVRLEHTASKYWPAVLALAESTNPATYAAWAAANPDKVLPVAVAQAA
jgi:hypothetical protein